MKHLISAAILAVALPAAASAATFTGSWNVSGSALSDPGLVVKTSAPGSLSFSLNDGESTTYDLFRIWTDEADVGKDDLVPRSLDVAFDIDSHGAWGTLGGTTKGEKAFPFQWGSVDWSAPLALDVGTGTLSIVLSGTKFNCGLLGLWKGWKHGGDVAATFSYVERTPAPIPLPAGFLLMGAAVGALGIAGHRRKAV